MVHKILEVRDFKEGQILCKIEQKQKGFIEVVVKKKLIKIVKKTKELLLMMKVEIINKILIKKIKLTNNFYIKIANHLKLYMVDIDHKV